MKLNKSIEEYSKRMSVISEYNYYTGDISEDTEEEIDELEDDESLEDGDDIEDADLDTLETDLEDTSEDEVEIDVSEIVDGVDQNSEEITNISSKLDSMGTQLGDYISKMMKTNKALANQVNQLEKNMSNEFKKRTPTPNEELFMRSMSSFPYNQKLTDYWKPAEGDEYKYSISNPNQEDSSDYQMKITKKSDDDGQPKEYVLTDKDIDDDYSEVDIRNSL